MHRNATPIAGTYAIGGTDTLLRLPATTANAAPGDTIVYRGQRQVATGIDANGNLHTTGPSLQAGTPIILLATSVPDTVPTDWLMAL